MNIETVVVGDLETNCYIAYDPETREAVVIDPGANAPKILGRIDSKGIKPVFVVLTHGHPDHFGSAGEVCKATSAKLLIHESDAHILESRILTLQGFMFSSTRVDQKLKDGDVIRFGKCSLRVLHTPGHSEGGICLYSDTESILFSGDTLFCDAVGRTDLPGGGSAELDQSVKRLLSLGDNVKVFPGHGPATTIKQEKSNLGFIK